MRVRNAWRSSAVRAVAVLGAAVLAAGVISPSLAAKKVNVAKIVKKQLAEKGPGLFIEEGELVRYGPIKLGVGGSAPVGTFGPFTLTAVCDQIDDDMDGSPLEERGQITIVTSEDNSSFNSNDDTEADFDAADPAEEWAEQTADDPGVPDVGSEDAIAWASAPSGTAIAALVNLIVLNQGGTACTFSGATFVLV